jgi:hypothetical protein
VGLSGHGLPGLCSRARLPAGLFHNGVQSIAGSRLYSPVGFFLRVTVLVLLAAASREAHPNHQAMQAMEVYY